MNAQIDIGLSEFYETFLTILSKVIIESYSINEIVCLGLGRISSCKIAQYQLGFLLLLAEKFRCSIEVFDPVFSSDDEQIIKQLKLKLLLTNCEGRKPANTVGCTLFVLPHCPKELSNNLLYTNWDPVHLNRCIIYANSFEKIRLHTPNRILENYYYIRKSLDIVVESAVSNTFRFLDIFNDLSLHHFPINLLQDVDNCFWKTPIPLYPEDIDQELITKE